MVFVVIIFVLVLSVGFYQSMHGLFNALIMTVLTLCCASLAIGYYEWVAVNWIAPRWEGSFAHAVAMASLFGVPLVILRVVLDKLIPRAALLPSWLDRAGAGVCGLVTAMILVGILATSLQLLPFHNGSVVGYSRIAIHTTKRVEDGPKPFPPELDEEELELWLTPDRFAVATVSLLSEGLFSSSRSFADDHPDVIESIEIGRASCRERV